MNKTRINPTGSNLTVTLVPTKEQETEGGIIYTLSGNHPLSICKIVKCGVHAKRFMGGALVVVRTSDLDKPLHDVFIIDEDDVLALYKEE